MQETGLSQSEPVDRGRKNQGRTCVRGGATEQAEAFQAGYFFAEQVRNDGPGINMQSVGVMLIFDGLIFQVVTCSFPVKVIVVPFFQCQEQSVFDACGRGTFIHYVLTQPPSPLGSQPFSRSLLTQVIDEFLSRVRLVDGVR